jgi:hypothetical protein
MRKQTRGRRIQTVEVPEFIIKHDIMHGIRRVKNDHPKAGKTIQIKHKTRN